MGGICLWKYDPDTFSYDIEYGVRNSTVLDLRNVRNVLQKYLNGQSEKDMLGTQKILYGIHVYDALKRYLEYCNIHDCKISVQPVYLVNDHLAILSMLLDMLEQNDEIVNLYTDLIQLQKSWGKITMSILKYDIYIDIGKSREKMVNYIFKQIDDYVDDERRFIVQLIDSIERHL